MTSENNSSSSNRSKSKELKPIVEIQCEMKDEKG
jgi:hypothetical protein